MLLPDATDKRLAGFLVLAFLIFGTLPVAAQEAEAGPALKGMIENTFGFFNAEHTNVLMVLLLFLIPSMN